MGIQVCLNEGPHLFPRGDDNKLGNVHWRNLKIFFSRTDEPIKKTHKLGNPLGYEDSSLLKWRATPFSRGDNNKMAYNYKIFLSRTDGPVSTKLCKKYPWVTEIKVYTNMGSHPYPRGDNNEILVAKVHWRNKSSLSWTNGTMSAKPGTNHHWFMRIKFV